MHLELSTISSVFKKSDYIFYLVKRNTFGDPHAYMPTENSKSASSQLGKIVRARRTALELTQQGLADLTGFSRGYVATLERTSGNVRLSTLDTLASALMVDVVDLFGMTKSREVRTPNQKANIRAACHVRRLRKKAGLSQERLSEAAGLFRTYVTELESLVSNPVLSKLEAIADVLDVPVKSLLKSASERAYEERLAQRSTRAPIPG